ncbi:alpha-N-acetylglucosaminidase [Nocardiopsis sp. MG754419]|uniref:alpha-N-acetylglucosaminidase n=1 Tax=Nocardiopsis sp. MG754419 TaxID=2259865 RepID=UPI001BA89C7D|nr:alpha-N-acetylglucosaminidase [Nocardiopsis sp. MG754419]MBR8743234.1 alpha-N-acetylglucosaminidase [Nocardiopsis sp. MG754419]
MADTTRTPPRWSGAVDALARRVLGPAHRPIVLRERHGVPRSYAYHADGGVLMIEATDAVAAAVGLHTYLRRECGRSVTWDTRLPLRLAHPPHVPLTHGTAETDQAYYLNFCTTGYTSAYWDWGDWEREIDWMALHGVTMPLTAVGHEAALFEAYTHLGLDPGRIREFLGGPGYLPWQYMGNLDGFAGPLPASWIDGHRDLGARILERQRDLGMTPVLPGFTGHVPRELVPGRTRSRAWHGLTTHVLDPADPRYPEIGAEIVRAQQRLYGTDHLYAIDPFIEMVPVDADPAFPAAVARATLDGLTRADPRAVWVLQTWPFSYQSGFWSTDRVTAFLDAIPDERLHLLDLWAEHDPQWSRFDAFDGTPWTWCALLNFGGRSDPIADLQGAVDRLGEAKKSAHPPTGVGLSMEGTRNNPAFFELVADQAWTRTEDVAGQWLPDFVRQRYGGDDPALLSGWRGLLDTVLGASNVRIFPEQFNGVLTAHPHYRYLEDPERHRAEVTGLVWYPWSRLLRAWSDLVGAAETDPALAEGPLGHDLADVAMAVLSRIADHRHLELVEHAARHREVPERLLSRFLEVFDDLDALLDTRPEYRYRTWEAQATSWATSTEDHRVLADNARRVLTVWITLDNLRLDDYAARLWSGMVGDYHRTRWELWGRLLPEALTDPERAASRLEDRLGDHSERFLRHGPAPTPASTGGTLTLSRRLLDRYGSVDRPGADAVHH